MADIIYQRAYSEVLAILSLMDDCEVSKIPNDIIDTFVYYSDKSYIVTIDANNLDNCNLQIQTKAILANLYRDYWVDTKQKQKILDFQKLQRKKYEIQKQECNVFENSQKIIDNANQAIEEQESKNLPIKQNAFVYKFKLLANKIKKYLKNFKR